MRQLLPLTPPVHPEYLLHSNKYYQLSYAWLVVVNMLGLLPVCLLLAGTGAESEHLFRRQLAYLAVIIVISTTPPISLLSNQPATPSTSTGQQALL